MVSDIGKFELIFRSHEGKVSMKPESFVKKYSEIFKEFKNKRINLLEIGVQNGGSLEIYAKYFLKANKIIGVDIDKNCEKLIFEDKRIEVVIGDIKEVEIEDRFDIIIDDGSHICSDVIKTFLKLFPKLNNNGLYIIEDLLTSYKSRWGGGLNDPSSTMRFLYALVDNINREHWEEKSKEKQLPIKSIEFMNSLCIIRKGENPNIKRLIVGEIANVNSGIMRLK